MRSATRLHAIMAASQAATDRIAAEREVANGLAQQRTRELHAVGEKATQSSAQTVAAVKQSNHFSEILKSQQQMIIAALGALGGLFGLLMRTMMNRVRRVREQIVKIEIMTNGNLEKLISAKDELLAAAMDSTAKQMQANATLQNRFIVELDRISANVHNLRNALVPLLGQITWEEKA